MIDYTEARKIKKIFVTTDGDPSCGIECNGAVIQADGDFILDTGNHEPDDRREVLNNLSTKIRDAFSVAWDGFIYVIYDFEMEDLQNCTEENESGVERIKKSQRPEEEII